MGAPNESAAGKSADSAEAENSNGWLNGDRRNGATRCPGDELRRRPQRPGRNAYRDGFRLKRAQAAVRPAAAGSGTFPKTCRYESSP